MKFFLFIIAVLIIGFITVNFICNPADFAPSLKKIERVEIISISDDTVKLSATMLLENGNPFGVAVSALHLSILYQGDKVGSSDLEEYIEIAANAEASVTIPLIFYTKKSLSLFHSDVDTVEFQLTGTADAKVSLLTVSTDVDIPLRVPLRENLVQALERDLEAQDIMTITGASLQKLGFEKTLVRVEYTIANPYDANFTLNGYPNDLYINGEYAGTGNIVQPLTVAPKETVAGTIDYSLDNWKSLKSMLGSLFSRKLSYTTKGVLNLTIQGKKIELPFTHSGNLLQI